MRIMPIFLAVALIICLAVLGHTVWHPAMLSLSSLLVSFFTGGHVVALAGIYCWHGYYIIGVPDGRHA